MRVTIKDIAEKTGVAVSTVSKSLNNKKGVSPITKQKILNTAKEMGYFSFHSTPNLRTYNIAFLMSRRHIPIFNNPFYSRVIAGVEIGVEKYDYNLLFSTIKIADLNNKEIPSIISKNKADGLILAGADINKEMIQAIEQLNFPTVLVDNYLKSPVMDSIVSDNYNGTMQAVKYLINKGHKKIGYAGGPNYHPSFKERYTAYKIEMMENQIDINDNFIKIESELSQDMGSNLAKRFLEEEELPTAIFAANDITAIGLIETFNEYGISVPDDISMVGFDNIELTAFTTPKITTISVDKIAMGQEAARKIFERINDPKRKATKSVITTELVERESVKKI